MRRALAIDEASYGPDHPNVATDLNNLAQLLQATNRLGEAEPLMRRALAIDEASYGPDHPNVAIRLNNLARLLQDTNRLGEAEPLMRRALAIDEASYGPDHPKVAIRLNNLAQLLKATNRLGEAEPLMRRALAIDEASYGPDHPEVATASTTSPVAESHQPARRGGTADAPRAGNRRGQLRPGPSECCDPPQQPRAVAARHQPARRGGTAVAAAPGNLSSPSSATPAMPIRSATGGQKLFGTACRHRQERGGDRRGDDGVGAGGWPRSRMNRPRRCCSADRFFSAENAETNENAEKTALRLRRGPCGTARRHRTKPRVGAKSHAHSLTVKQRNLCDLNSLSDLCAEKTKPNPHARPTR